MAGAAYGTLAGRFRVLAPDLPGSGPGVSSCGGTLSGTAIIR